jgi:[acyl-carrier-protein] S-malonyltransferase
MRPILTPMSLPKNTAFIFPGQGSQVVGMGQTLAEADPQAAAVFEEADQVLAYPLSEICWRGPEEVLNDTVHTQPALLTHSVAVLRAFKARHPDFEPACMAGHSLGEYSALVASRSLDFHDALRLVQARGRAMKEAGQRHPGGMAAVLGLELETVERICKQVSSEDDGAVWLANDNCPGQIVISGHEQTLQQACELLENQGARKVIRLAVSIASHTPLMATAQQAFAPYLQNTTVRTPQIPTLSNVTAAPHRSAEEVRATLHEQLVSRVRWTESVGAMIQAGVSTFIELGPGNVLTGLIRRIDRSTTGFALDSPESFTTLTPT